MNIDPTKDALIVVDPQNDFCPGGSLAVPGGDRAVEVCGEAVELFHGKGALVVVTQDWHPVDHSSFTSQGGPWPAHCVGGTWGARIHDNLLPTLSRSSSWLSVCKGTNPEVDAYSGFLDSNLEAELCRVNIKRVFVCGLATDYCVLNTVLDARKLGLEVVVLVSAIAAVNVHPDDGAKAIQAMHDAGAQILVSMHG